MTARNDPPSAPTCEGSPARLGLIGRIKRRWLGFNRSQKTLWLLAILLFVIGLQTRLVVAWLSPRLEVAAAQVKPGSGGWNRRKDRGDWKGKVTAQDPWGNRLVGTKPTIRAKPSFYSVGPNGLDEEGQGDDLVPTALESRLGERLASLKGGCVSLGLLLIWFVHGPTVGTPRSPQIGREAIRALNFGTGLLLFLPGPIGLILNTRDITPYVEAIGETFPLLVHPLVAVIATYAMLCFFLALGWRLSRAPEGEVA